VNRHRSYYPLDDAPVLDKDEGWNGVNLRLKPDQLPDGMGAAGINLRFEGGVAKPRGGARLLNWSNRSNYLGDPTKIQTYGRPRGGGVYSDPNGVEWIITIAGESTLTAWKCRPGNGSSEIPMPPATPASDVRLIQTWSGMVMLRGPGLTPLFLSDLREGWKEVPYPEAQGAIQPSPVPASDFGVYWQNRLLVVDGRTEEPYADSLWVSDFGANVSVLQGPHEYWNNFRINPGSSDALTGAYPLNEQTLLVVKTGSVHAISGVAGTTTDIAQNAQLETLTLEYGCRSPGTLCQVGRDVWFLSHRRGVVSVALTAQGKAQGVDLPASRDIQPLIDSINWECAHRAVATYHNNRYYLAVPLYGATVNNAVLVYDSTNGAWSGYDNLSGSPVLEWIRFTWLGSQRLGFISTTGLVYLYEDGAYDQMLDEDGVVQWTPVNTVFWSRGYGGREPGRKAFGRMRVCAETWNPYVRCQVNTDGQREAQVLRDAVTMDRTKYMKAGMPAYDPENPNDDHAQPFRDDYSVVLPVEPNTSGVNWDATQIHSWTWPVRRRGGYVQIILQSVTGRTLWRGIEIEMSRAGVRYGKDE
jgi:hypothetical protein